MTLRYAKLHKYMNANVNVIDTGLTILHIFRIRIHFHKFIIVHSILINIKIVIVLFISPRLVNVTLRKSCNTKYFFYAQISMTKAISDLKLSDEHVGPHTVIHLLHFAVVRWLPSTQHLRYGAKSSYVWLCELVPEPVEERLLYRSAKVWSAGNRLFVSPLIGVDKFYCIKVRKCDWAMAHLKTARCP